MVRKPVLNKITYDPYIYKGVCTSVTATTYIKLPKNDEIFKISVVSFCLKDWEHLPLMERHVALIQKGEYYVPGSKSRNYSREYLGRNNISPPLPAKYVEVVKLLIRSLEKYRKRHHYGWVDQPRAGN